MTKKLPLLLAFSICAALLLVACGGGGSNTANTANTTSNTAASNTAASNTSTASTSGDKIGVAECDDYIAKYEACLNSKVPEAMRATYKGAFETARKMWRDAAATPQGRAGLAQACKTAHDQARQAFGSYGCSW